MGNSEVRLRPAKVQPSLVSTVAVVDISGFQSCVVGFSGYSSWNWRTRSGEFSKLRAGYQIRSGSWKWST